MRMRGPGSKTSLSCSFGVALTLAFSTLSCSVDDRPVTVASSIDPSDAFLFCESYLDARANREVICEGGSLTVLETAFHAVDYCRFVDTEISSGSINYDPDAASACLGELSVLACWRASAADCSRVFSGTIPEGGSCFLAAIGADECVSGSHCVADVACPGTCVRYAQLGESCSGDDSSLPTFCSPELTCGPNALCETDSGPSPSVGTPCSSIDDCLTLDIALSCKGSSGPVAVPGQTAADGGAPAGTCQAPGDDGPCVSEFDCRSKICSEATSTSTQFSCLPPKVAGDACVRNFDQCGPGTYCGPASECVLDPSVGQSCAGLGLERPQCANGVCDSTSWTCVPFGKQGDPCLMYSCSVGLTCDSYASGTCLPSCIRGSACGAPGQVCCAGQLCHSGSACLNATCVTGQADAGTKKEIRSAARRLLQASPDEMP
jgi:hypothetical protein